MTAQGTSEAARRAQLEIEAAQWAYENMSDAYYAVEAYVEGYERAAREAAAKYEERYKRLVEAAQGVILGNHYDDCVCSLCQALRAIEGDTGEDAPNAG